VLAYTFDVMSVAVQQVGISGPRHTTLAAVEMGSADA
jgi:hypothetical protein